MDPKLLMKILQVTFTGGPVGGKNRLNWHSFHIRLDSWDRTAVPSKIPIIVLCWHTVVWPFWIYSSLSLLITLIQSLCVTMLHQCKSSLTSAVEELGSWRQYDFQACQLKCNYNHVTITETDFKKFEEKNCTEVTDNAGIITAKSKERSQRCTCTHSSVWANCWAQLFWKSCRIRFFYQHNEEAYVQKFHWPHI